MVAVFAHDHVFRTCTGGVYSSGKLPYAAWRRYLERFASLHVIGRSSPVAGNELSGLDLASGAGVEFTFVPTLGSARSWLGNRRAARRIIQDVVGTADVVIARLPSQIGSLAVQVARAQGKPWAVEVVGCAWDAYWHHGSWLGKAFAPVAYLAMRRIVSEASDVIYVSRFVERRYPSAGRRVRASNVQIDPVPAEVLIARERKVPNEVLRIGLIGSLDRTHKGVDVALRALAEIAPRLPTFELAILGAGNAGRLGELARRLGIEDRVRFCGTLRAGEEVAAWLDTMDLYLQPSRTEGLPRSLIEAMSRGCPALGSSAGGIPELLVPDAMHRPGDWRRLGKQIVRATTDTSWRREQSRRNFEVADGYTRSKLDPVRAAFWSNVALRAREALSATPAAPASRREHAFRR